MENTAHLKDAQTAAQIMDSASNLRTTNGPANATVVGTEPIAAFSWNKTVTMIKITIKVCFPQPHSIFITVI